MARAKGKRIERRGGARPGAGRPPKILVPLPKSLAAELFEDGSKNADGKVITTRARWEALRNSGDENIRCRVEMHIWDRYAGKPAITKSARDPVQPQIAEFGNLPMPDAPAPASAAEPGKAGKPN